MIKMVQRRGIALFDVDGPLRGGNIAHWPEYLAQEGLFSIVALEKVRADVIALHSKRTTYKEFAKNILNHMAQGVKGQSAKKVKAATRKFVMQPNLMKLHPHAVELVNRMNQRGISVAVTAQPHEFAEALMQILPFHMAFGTELEVVGGKYSGQVKRNLSIEKGTILKELKRHPQYWRGISYGFGDRVTDANMLRETTKPIALNPDEKMRKYAKRKKWGIAKGSNILSRIRKR